MPKDKSRGKGKGKAKAAPISGLQGYGYSHIESFQTVYKSIKKDSVETDVDEMWMFILRRYFPNDDRSGEEWSIVQQQRPKPRTLRKADILIRIVAKNRMVNICFLEDKRYFYERRSSSWAEAVVQLQNYMLESRSSHSLYFTPTHLFGAVNIGRHVRFYVLPNGQTQLQDFMAASDGQPYEVLRNEREIDQVLMHWNREGRKYTSW